MLGRIVDKVLYIFSNNKYAYLYENTDVVITLSIPVIVQLVKH